MTDDLRALSAAATPGPWRWDDDELIGSHLDDEGEPIEELYEEFILRREKWIGGVSTPDAADGDFVVALVNAHRSGALTETAPLREALVSVATYRAEQDVAFDDADADWRLIARKMESIARRALDASEADRG